MTWRSWTLVSASVLAGLVALVLLATMQFESTLTRFVQGRLAILAQSMELPFRSATALGLPLASVRNAAAILERTRQTDPSVVAIHVYDNLGRIVHSTALDPPDTLDGVALQAYQEAEGSTWAAEAGDQLLSSVLIFNTLGTQSLGGVVVVYPRSGITTATLAMFARLTVTALGIAAAAAAVSFPILAFVLGRLDRSARSVDAALGAIERSEWRGRAGGGQRSEHAEEWEDATVLTRDAGAADEQYRRAGLELAELERAADTAKVPQ